MVRRINQNLSIFLYFTMIPALHGQGHDWWATNVGWDGITHWSEYIRYGAAYMGPNALPVPEIASAFLPDQNSIEIATAGHFMPGDPTLNLKLSASWIPARRICFDLNYIPVEWYRTSHEIKTERHVFHTFYDSRRAMGDLTLATRYQLLLAKRTVIAIRWGFRFPTSTMQGAARYTNAPGYFTDVTISTRTDKPLITAWRFHLMTGFYAWQTNQDEQFQNDAFLTGIGLSKQFHQFQIRSSVRGYFGYLNIGDSPVIADLRSVWQGRQLDYLLALYRGLHDYQYTSIELGIRYRFDDQPKSATP